MREILEKLSEKGTVNDAFIERLENAGFEIHYGKFLYWDYQPFVKIGCHEVFLTEGKYINGDTFACEWRSQSDVAESIFEAIKEEEELCNKVDDFFGKLAGHVILIREKNVDGCGGFAEVAVKFKEKLTDTEMKILYECCKEVSEQPDKDTDEIIEEALENFETRCKKSYVPADISVIEF